MSDLMDQESTILKRESVPLYISGGKAISRIAYHDKLNVIFVGTYEKDIFVVDPTLGEILYHTKIGEEADAQDAWDFNISSEKIIIAYKDRIGIRSEYNGILLLDSVLQTPVSHPSEIIQIELNKAEAESLTPSLSAIEFSDSDSIEVEKSLKEALVIASVSADSLISVKKEKWCTIKLDMEYSKLKNTFQSMVSELWKKNAYIPQLAIASSILERLNLHFPIKIDYDLPLDKNQMFSETARLNTFYSWPHMDYKWALPEKMAQAGFYHNPSAHGDDRAMCFTCNVCLVSWEPTDEPWSEHERHSPFCPFVRGEHTHNVPLCLSYSAAPAFTVKKAEGHPTLGRSSLANFFVVAYENGTVVVYSIDKIVKEIVEFKVSVKDFKSESHLLCYSDIDLKPKEAWVCDSNDVLPAGTLPENLLCRTEDIFKTKSACLLGSPQEFSEQKQKASPSLLLSGILNTVKTFENEQVDRNTSPILLVYGINFLTTKDAPEEKKAEDLQSTGNSGTKQDVRNPFEEEVCGSYMSETDLMSDSVSIFSDMNLSESSGTFIVDANGQTTQGLPLKPQLTSYAAPSIPAEVLMKKKGTVIATPKKKTPFAETKTLIPKVTLAQKINLPSELKGCLETKDILPSADGARVALLLVNPSDVGEVFGAILVFNVVVESKIVMLDREPSSVLIFKNRDEVPLALSLINIEGGESLFGCPTPVGLINILNFNNLDIFAKISPVSPTKYTSVSYCSAMEKICCGTNTGSIEFYSIDNQVEPETNDKQEASLFKGTYFANEKCDGKPEDLLLVKQPLTTEVMSQLLQLTAFENINPCFSVNVPSCWIKIIQAQKERKHPQHLQHQDCEISKTTLSWRLQRNKNSKDEHLFEITLPKAVHVGHLDMKFLFQIGCISTPKIEVTLYRSSSNKLKQAPKTLGMPIDSRINFGNEILTTPNNEFLKSIGAEAVCGPLDLGSHVDLSAQGGNVVMTSPALMLRRGRNFYLHIKSKYDDNEEASSVKVQKEETHTQQNSCINPLEHNIFKRDDVCLLMDQVNFKKAIAQSQASKYYETCGKDKDLILADNMKDFDGCDWLHEISITIRQAKTTLIPFQEKERNTMLTSPDFLCKLLKTAVFEGVEKTASSQDLAFDILIWIAAINLCGPEINNSTQMEFIQTVEKKLNELILYGILQADRSTAHKCAKLLVLCIDAAEGHDTREEARQFLQSMLKTLLALLPYTISAVSAGSLQWYFLLCNRVRGENLNLVSESILMLLKDVTNELCKRITSKHALLRTRFGLYGTPFESDLFEIELPPVTKSFSHPLTYAGICGGNDAPIQTTSSTFHLWGLKDVDFRDLLIGNPVNLRWNKFGSPSPKQQVQGLLEVEPLHFTCHAASDGTRIEKIDQNPAAGYFSAVPLPQPWEPFTNMPTGEGSKKSDPDKMEQIMMLQKALKMDNHSAYYDVLSDLNFMENHGLGMIEMQNPGEMSQIAHPNIPWKNVGVLTMVMPPGGNPGKIAVPSLPKDFDPSKMLAFGSMMHSSHSFIQNSSTSGGGPSLNVIKEVKEPQLPKEGEKEDLRLLLSPWQQMMYVPPQQALVIDRMHSGARRFVVLDFGAPILLTDIVIPTCSDLVSLSIDIWIQREELDGQRLIVASDIGSRSLVICDLQPPPACRYLKITTIGRYGMGTTKCRIPIGMFYGHTTILPNDVKANSGLNAAELPVLNPANVQANLSVLSYLVEDIECRYQLACAKLNRLLDPIVKPEITSLDHISYYLPKGKERTKLGFNHIQDQSINSAYQECITLQQQLNMAKNVVNRLQRSLTSPQMSEFSIQRLSDICTDKVHLISEFLIESLLSVSYLASPSSQIPPQSSALSLYTHMDQKMCESLFQEICVMENGQCQLSTCTLMLRVCGFQPWWGKFLSSTLSHLFSSLNDYLFPQDRVFILLVYLGQKALINGKNSSVLENAMELLIELLEPLEDKRGFLRSKVDMSLLGWVLMYICLCFDGVNCTFASGATDANGNQNAQHKKSRDTKEGSGISSRWDFIQGESSLYRRITGPSKLVTSGCFKRRIQKKILATKQKLEELDNVAAGLGYANQSMFKQQMSGLGTQLSALGNKIEAIKQKQVNIGKNIKLQSTKHFKDLLQIRRTEMLNKSRGLSGVKEGKESSVQEVEITLCLSQVLCQNVTKGLASLLLKMDSTCHSDVYLIICKALARIATACRPAISLGEIFDSEQIFGIILTAVGVDQVRLRNWSSPWISHAIMCLVQDILEGEKFFPRRSEDSLNESNSMSENIMSNVEDQTNPSSTPPISEDMSIDDVDAEVIEVNEMMGTIVDSNPIEISMMDSEESDFDEVPYEFAFHNPTEARHNAIAKKAHIIKKLSPCATSISTAIDARLENGVDSTTELRLRMMSVVDSEILSQALKSPIEVSSEILKNFGLPRKNSLNAESPSATKVNSLNLLAGCFDRIFEMMSSENCSVNIEKLLQLWLSFNLEISGTEDSYMCKPSVPLSRESISSLMMTFSKNRGIGIQEWGLAFQCLSLAANQRALNSTNGFWLNILSDKYFPEMILKFISGTGMNLQKTNLVTAGPTVCQHFYNFLLRLRQLSNDTPWTLCLKEVLLRVLSLFLAGPFINTDFPLDAFNKFLDRVTCPDLSYENPSTVVSIIEYFAQVLHLFIFLPNKLSIRSPDLKGFSSNTTLTSGTEAKFGKIVNFEHVMFRLTSFMSSLISLPFKASHSPHEEIKDFLSDFAFSSQIKSYDTTLNSYVEKCGEHKPKTIADIVFQMEPTMMRILSVLANPNGINVLVSGDLLSAFNIMETSTPANVVDSVISLFSKMCSSASQPQWPIQPIFKFLSKSPFDDFYCPLTVSETFVLLVLKVISKEEHLKEFINSKCVESICEKMVSNNRSFFSSCPTFVSILTQYIGRTDSNALFGQKKFNNEPIELQEGLINVAPLGTITSNNFSAHPSEVLLQATPPHRRARTPVWSYHFFPEESYLELIITLPCAVLLKEVQIVPHMTSLSSACPAGIMVEVSKDKSAVTLPLGPPIQCTGLSSINIALSNPEVAQTVLLRLFKPKDTNNLGLSQIRLLGSTTFSEAASQGLTSENIKTLDSSAQWMYILDRAITVSKVNKEMYLNIVEKSVNTPDLLESCYSMLLVPLANGKTQDVYLPHVASVLFEFGSFRKDVSEALMKALLEPIQMGLSHGMVANGNSQLAGSVSQLNTVIELIYKLCCNVLPWGFDNLTILVNWLENCADEAIKSNEIGTRKIIAEYVQAVSAVLWAIVASGKTDLTSITTPSLLKKLYSWSSKLSEESELKAAVDHVICAVCYSKPWLFILLMFEMGIIPHDDWTEKDLSNIEDTLGNSYEEGIIHERIKVRYFFEDGRNISGRLLMTLGRAAQSRTASNILHLTNFLPLINILIMDFWDHYTKKWLSFNSTHEFPSSSHIISTQALIEILGFYTELCRVNEFKNWFGSQGSIFWLPLLTFLSTLPGNVKSNFFGSLTSNLESALIKFFANCCWSHPENQKAIANILCDIIMKQKPTPHKAAFLHSMSSFYRRLLIQLLLENEKVIVHIKSTSKYPLKNTQSRITMRDKHPSLGVLSGDRIFYFTTHSTTFDLMKSLEPTGTSLERLSIGSTEPGRFVSILKKEQGVLEAGLEMIDQMQLSLTGNAAKDKRANDGKRPYKLASKKLKSEADSKTPISSENENIKSPILCLEAEDLPEVRIPPNTLISTLMAASRQQRPDTFLDVITFNLRSHMITLSGTTKETSGGGGSIDVEQSLFNFYGRRENTIPDILDISPISSTIEVFSRIGGLGLLAKHLPVVYPETLRQISAGSKSTGPIGVVMNMDKDSPMTDSDWVKIENSDDLYEEMMDSMATITTPMPKRSLAMRQLNTCGGVPPHSMAAFGLFLSLPRFSEVLLGERIGAQNMLRLVMGVTDDADGNDIFVSGVAKNLPTLPFNVLRCLLDMLPLSSSEGKNLRRAMVDLKAIHFILACLAVFTHQVCDSVLIPGLQHELVIAATKAQGGYQDKGKNSDDKSHVYWAKGTGFGTGSTVQSWDVELAMQKKKAEEENVTCLLGVLSSYINPRGSGKEEPTADVLTQAQSTSTAPTSTLPHEMSELIKTSCLFPAIAGYLRNDSVLDMARHVPLYKSVLLFLRALVVSPELVPLLAPWERRVAASDEQPISCLLTKMKDIVDNYTKRLTSGKGTKTKVKSTGKTIDDVEDEGLAQLIPDIKSTAILVEDAVTQLILNQEPNDVEMKDLNSTIFEFEQKTLEERYIEEMKKLQFGFYEMIVEEEDGSGIRFAVSHHYEGNVRTNWARSFPARIKRLAQESVTLSTSLPIAYGSTIFVRSDVDRLDVMKVLITGPSGTPYSNGCFEFDVFFPNDYPNSPMMINLETTGRQRVRFNPNLYTDGKVCLSILNTWHGRPEEKWNPQTSSLLPVLVAIQSLILNAEPYFNEPGYEKSRGTEAGERNSREYNAGIEIATLEWGMLDQIRHPSACFKDVIHRHFWMKRAEVAAQCDKWYEDLIVTCKNDKRAGKNVTGAADPVTVFKNNLALLKKEFRNMKPPQGLDEFVDLYPTKDDEICLNVGSPVKLDELKVGATDQSPSSPIPSTSEGDSSIKEEILMDL